MNENECCGCGKQLKESSYKGNIFRYHYTRMAYALCEDCNRIFKYNTQTVCEDEIKKMNAKMEANRDEVCWICKREEACNHPDNNSDTIGLQRKSCGCRWNSFTFVGAQKRVHVDCLLERLGEVRERIDERD